MTGIVDGSELRDLATDLGRVSGAVVVALEPVVKKAAQNVKDEWARNVSGSGRWKHYPRSISYDRALTVTGIEYEVGPDKDRPQGPLGNIAEFGTSTLPPANPGGAAALDAEAPRFEDALGDVLGDLL